MTPDMVWRARRAAGSSWSFKESHMHRSQIYVAGLMTLSGESPERSPPVHRSIYPGVPVSLEPGILGELGDRLHVLRGQVDVERGHVLLDALDPGRPRDGHDPSRLRRGCFLLSAADAFDPGDAELRRGEPALSRQGLDLGGELLVVRKVVLAKAREHVLHHRVDIVPRLGGDHAPPDGRVCEDDRPGLCGRGEDGLGLGLVRERRDLDLGRGDGADCGSPLKRLGGAFAQPDVLEEPLFLERHERPHRVLDGHRLVDPPGLEHVDGEGRKGRGDAVRRVPQTLGRRVGMQVAGGVARIEDAQPALPVSFATGMAIGREKGRAL